MTVAWAVIDLDALRHNFRLLRARAGCARVMAVVKADAYGHGLVPVARALAEEADALAVAHLSEARVLRRAGIRTPIVLLHGALGEGEWREVLALGLQPVVHRAGQVDLLERLRPARPPAVWLKVDTGMHRLGVAPAELPELHRRLTRLLDGPPRLLSHLACADEPDGAFHARQVERFLSLTEGLPGERSLANSAALLGRPDLALDWVRPGIALYGASPFPGRRGGEWGLRAAMTFQARLIAVRALAAGEAVGYGAAWRAPRDLPLGTVAAGYGDGYPRACPSGTPVHVRGRPAALAGRVSMDLITLDLSAAPGAVPGDAVTLWGGDLPVETVAAAAGTIPYELLTRLGGRVERRYTGAGDG